jgi:PAS domain S-box-containing protein
MKALRLGDHLGCLHETEVERRDVLARGVREGLAAHERVVYLADPELVARGLDDLRDEGLDAHALLASGQLRVPNPTDTALARAALAPDSMADWVRSATARAVADGQAGLRLIEDMTWTMRELRGPERLLEYEGQLDAFVGGASCVAICLYDRERFDPALLLDVVPFHPLVAIGTTLFENPHHPPPAASPAARLRHWIGALASRARAAEGMSRLAAIVESADDAIVSWTVAGEIESWNRGAERMYGYTAVEAIGRPMALLIPADRPDELSNILTTIDRGGRVHQYETVRLRNDGTRISVSLTVSPIRDRDGTLTSVSTIARDMTGRKRTEELLRESEARFRSIFEHSLDAVLLASIDGRVYAANPAACAMFGRTEAELRQVGREGVVDVTDPRLAPILEERRRVGASRGELRLLRRDGTTFEGETSGVLFTDHAGNERMVLIIRDITERKRAEDELLASRRRLRALTAHLQSVREDERLAIAQELNENLAQGLVSVQWELTRLAAKTVADEPALAGELAALLATVDTTILGLRRISTTLYPSMLRDFGLVSTLEWQVADLGRRTSIDGRFVSDVGDVSLDPKDATAMLRISQEALSNVERHSAAAHVIVRFHRDRNDLVLSVEDDGRGISEESVANDHSLGILEMRERALFLGGEFEIVGRPDGGTTVTVRMPFPRPSSAV